MSRIQEACSRKGYDCAKNRTLVAGPCQDDLRECTDNGSRSWHQPGFDRCLTRSGSARWIVHKAETRADRSAAVEGNSRSKSDKLLMRSAPELPTPSQKGRAVVSPNKAGSIDALQPAEH